MSQFQGAYEEPDAAAAERSKLSIAALVCSLIFCCPLTTLLGPILGLIALAKMGAKKGRGMAIAAILIGAVLTGGWGFLFYFWGQAIAVVMAGPTDALQAGFNGDIAAFKAQFHGAGAAASDAEARAFIDELRRRYGAYQSCHFNDQSTPRMKFGQPATPFPYTITFAQATMDAEAEIVFGDPASGRGFVMKLGYIVVFDPDQGDLHYPPAAAGP